MALQVKLSQEICIKFFIVRLPLSPSSIIRVVSSLLSILKNKLSCIRKNKRVLQIGHSVVGMVGVHSCL